MAQFKLKKDIVIPAGTIFNCVDGETRKYLNGNYSHLVALSNNTCGELIYGIETGFKKEESEWFEEIKNEKV